MILHAPSRAGRNARSTLACTLLVGLLVGAHAQAADNRLLDLSLEELLHVEITSAGKKAQTIAETAAAAFVITQDDIRRSGARSIPEVLRLARGVEVAQIDGNKWAVSVRGFNGRFANKLLVLMDGRALYTPSFGGVFWDVQDTLMQDIERIEVIRGPGGASWGVRVSSVQSGAEALARAMRRLPHYEHVPLIMMSSVSASFALGDSVCGSPTAWLSKPVRQPQLHTCLTSILAHERPTPSTRSAPAAADRAESAVRALPSQVLLVEDNPVNQELAQAMLRELGMQVSSAWNGIEALAMLSEQRFDAVLMDCQMPAPTAIRPRATSGPGNWSIAGRVHRSSP